MKLGMETETIEYKKTTGELREGVISIVAILNKHNGGELYFGVKNDGEVVGQDISDKTLRDVSQAVYNHIEPQIFPDISNVVIHNRDCIRVAFEGDNVPYYAYGRAYLRVADEDRVMSPKELEVYILRRNADKVAWDSGASKKTVDDVNEEALKNYIAMANAAGRIDYAYTDKRDILKRLKLLNEDKLSNTAEVMFCDDVNLEIQMAVFASDERLTFIDINRKSGTVTELVKIGEDYIKDKMRWRVEFDGSIQRKEIPEVPIDAVREALVNSYCHRAYRVHQTNEIAIFKNRIEIYNPGTFPAGLTPQDFLEGSGHSIQRNPLLAQILYYSKDIEKFGTGLQRIANACKEADVRVEFKMLKLGFAVVFYREEKVVDYLGRVIKDKANNDVGIVKNIVDNIAETISVTATQEMIIKLMHNNPKITAKAIAQEIGIAPRNAQVHIQNLKAMGLIERIGAAKGGHWVVKLPE